MLLSAHQLADKWSHIATAQKYGKAEISLKDRLLESRLEFKTPFCTQMSGHLNLFAYPNILF